jgi:hypothetical protein
MSGIMMLSLTQFRALRPQVRALVYLYWIYMFATAVIGVFTQIYVYQTFSSVSFNIVTSMLSFTGLMLSFCGYGAVAARLGISSRYGFLLSFLFTSVGIVMLAGAGDIPGAASAMTMIGTGAGFFWLTIHTYELVETHDHERDVYSTYLSAGTQIIFLVGPAVATALIYTAHVLGWSELVLLFLATPFIFILGFFFFDSLSDYRPAPIRGVDVAHFVSDSRNRAAQLYLFGGAASHILQESLLPLVLITVLGTTLHVGSFNTVFAIVGAAALLLVGAHRHSGNRLHILGICAGVIMILSILLGHALSVLMLIVYAFGTNIAQPLLRVSEHVIDLQTLGSVGHHESDFYPTMIFRDFSLWAWRMVAGFALLAVISSVDVDAQALTIGMYFIAGSFVLLYVGASILLAAQKRSQGGAA